MQRSNLRLFLVKSGNLLIASIRALKITRDSKLITVIVLAFETVFETNCRRPNLAGFWEIPESSLKFSAENLMKKMNHFHFDENAKNSQIPVKSHKEPAASRCRSRCRLARGRERSNKSQTNNRIQILLVSN